MSNEGSRDRQVPYFIWEVFSPHWQCLTFPYHSRLVNGWSASPPENKRVSRLFSVTIYRGPLSPARRKQEFPEDTRVKCLKESDMMLPQMGTVLTSEGTQPARRGDIISLSFKHFTRVSSGNSCFRRAGDSG